MHGQFPTFFAIYEKKNIQDRWHLKAMHYTLADAIATRRKLLIKNQTKKRYKAAIVSSVAVKTFKESYSPQFRFN